MTRPLSRISIAQWPSDRPASSCSAIHRASTCRISSRSATRGIAGVSRRATSRWPKIASAASASSTVDGRNRRRLVISSSVPATTWTWAPSHIDYSLSPTRPPVSTPIPSNHNTKGLDSPRTVLSSLSGAPRQGYQSLFEGLFEPGGTTVSRPTDSHAETTAAATHSTQTDTGAATTAHDSEYERAHRWRDATRGLVLAGATAMAAAHQPQSQ